MTEIAVADLARSVAWYGEVLGLTIEKRDDANHFVLLTDTTRGRMALRQDRPTPAGISLYFHVENLTDEIERLTRDGVKVEPMHTSDEGYRRVLVHDPDGYRIGLFEWSATLSSPRGTE